MEEWRQSGGGSLRRLSALVLVGLVLASGCQGWGGARLEPWLESAPARYHSASPPAFAQPQPEDDGGGGTVGGAQLGRFMAFVRQRQAALRGPRVPEAERRVGEAALLELLAWLHGQSEETLAREEPEEVYLRFQVARVQRGREDAARDAAVERKLEEYWQWARERSRLLAGRHFRKAGRQWLVTESPVYEGAQDALTQAVLGWAHGHTQDPDYLRKSPQEVAVYLLAKRGALATALEVGTAAPPRLEFVPEPVHAVPAEEVLVEVAVGLVPGVGESVDLMGAVGGVSVLGRRLSPEERVLCAVALLVPLVAGGMLLEGAEASGAALRLGRGVGEVEVLQRVAQHLAPEEARRVRELLRKAGRGGQVPEAELAWMRELAERLRGPLAEVAGAVKAGARVPLVGSRVTVEGARLVPGSAEHLAQAWVDYQFRHPGKYPRFRYAPEAWWERMYRTVLENRGQGGAFEQEVLKAKGCEKNTALMLPPPGSKAEQGFVPDSVLGNPEELVWGRPYRFVEVKGRAEMALTGNLKAMIEYVEAHGGHVEVWLRSANHPSGGTRLTQPLDDRLDRLFKDGKATVKYFP
jgi:hypothetical protein